MNQGFADLLRSFLDGEVRFLVVGTYALAIHGYPRATGVLDLWIDATPENGEKTYRALAQFGAPLARLAVADLSMPGIIFQIGVAPFRIDILTVVSGLDFAEAWRNRIEGNFEGQTFPVFGSADLLKNKRATGRPKDQVDADALEMILKIAPVERAPK